MLKKYMYLTGKWVRSGPTDTQTSLQVIFKGSWTQHASFFHHFFNTSLRFSFNGFTSWYTKPKHYAQLKGRFLPATLQEQRALPAPWLNMSSVTEFMRKLLSNSHTLDSRDWLWTNLVSGITLCPCFFKYERETVDTFTPWPQYLIVPRTSAFYQLSLSPLWGLIFTSCLLICRLTLLQS